MLVFNCLKITGFYLKTSHYNAVSPHPNLIDDEQIFSARAGLQFYEGEETEILT